MANIRHGMKKKQETTMKDILEEGKHNSLVFGPDKFDLTQEEKDAIKRLTTLGLKDYGGTDPKKLHEKRLAYNAQLFETIPQEYFDLQLDTSILVRYFTRVPDFDPKKKTFVYAGDSITLEEQVFSQAMGGSGDRYTNEKIDEIPYRFMTKVVIVNIPSFVSDIEIGSVWAANRPELKAPLVGNKAVYYPGLFIHPNFEKGKLPTNLQDPNYGYRLVSRNELIALIPNEGWIYENNKKQNEK